jgi:hypothetical protein
MSAPWHRIGLYFGLVEDTADDRRIREALPTPSVARFVLGSVIASVLGGALFGILNGDVRSGVIFGVVMAIVLTCQALWRRSEKS